MTISNPFRAFLGVLGFQDLRVASDYIGSDFRFRQPLASGYLKAYTEKYSSVPPKITIGDRFFNHWYGDKKIIESLISDQYDLIGFSCYVWNIERTLNITRKIKEQCGEDHVIIILGGPEISFRTIDELQNLFEVGLIDYAILGEGEQAFYNLVSQLKEDNRMSSPIPGVISKVDVLKRDILIPTAWTENLETIPSPYLTNALSFETYNVLDIETMRGCPYSCSYCSYNKNFKSLRYFSEDRIIKEIQMAINAGVQKCYLMDPTFNANPKRMRHLCQQIALINNKKRMKFHTEIRAETITKDDAIALRDANVVSVEVGLQTVNESTCALINRKNNLEKFEMGTRILEDTGISVHIGVIIGLPDEGYKEVDKTIDFLVEKNFVNIDYFFLQLLPGTDLRQQAQKLGMIYDNQPPYYITGTRGHNKDELGRILSHAARRIQNLKYKINPSNLFLSNYPKALCDGL